MAFVHFFSIFQLISKWFWALWTPPQLPVTPLAPTKPERSLEDLIQIYVEEAEVDTLKTLREMNSKWDKCAKEELEKRAVQNQFQLQFYGDIWSRAFGQFLENTSGNPQLFRSFWFNFPESFKFIHSSFFFTYKPIFFFLEISQNFKFTDPDTHYSANIFSMFASTLEELEVERIDDLIVEQQVLPFNQPAQSGHLVLHKLNKIKLKVYEKDNFQFILNKSGAVDPTPNLTTLHLEIWCSMNFVNLIGSLNSIALSRWSQLINLTIEYNYILKNDRFTASLLSLGKAGMSLKMLNLKCVLVLSESELTQLCSNLSHFFAIQAKSLQILKFVCRLSFEKASNARPKIRFPIFENVHTLHLALPYQKLRLGGRFQDRIFEMGPIVVHFPKLDHLRIYEEDLVNVYRIDGDLVEAIPLKSLNIQNDIMGERNNLDAWSPKFRSVKELTCKGSLLSFENHEVPWEESLKILKIYDMEAPIKVSHLTSLRKLIVNVGYTNLHEEYLTYLDQVRSLKLSEIIFKTREKPSDEIKARFIRYFPFPVKFQ